jgi:hypothetical protein
MPEQVPTLERFVALLVERQLQPLRADLERQLTERIEREIEIGERLAELDAVTEALKQAADELNQRPAI